MRIPSGARSWKRQEGPSCSLWKATSPEDNPDLRLLPPQRYLGHSPGKLTRRLTQSLPSERQSRNPASPCSRGLWAFRASGCQLCSRATRLTHSPPHPQAPMSAPRPGRPRALLGSSCQRFRLPSRCGCNTAVDQTGALGNQRHDHRKTRAMCCLRASVAFPAPRLLSGEIVILTDLPVTKGPRVTANLA